MENLRRSESKLVGMLKSLIYIAPVAGDIYFYNKIKKSALPRFDKIFSLVFFLSFKYYTYAWIGKMIYD